MGPCWIDPPSPAPHGEIANPAAYTGGQTTICRLLPSALVTNNIMQRTKYFENPCEPAVPRRATSHKKKLRNPQVSNCFLFDEKKAINCLLSNCLLSNCLLSNCFLSNCFLSNCLLLNYLGNCLLKNCLLRNCLLRNCLLRNCLLRNCLLRNCLLLHQRKQLLPLRSTCLL
jgi:hypothetical protein